MVLREPPKAYTRTMAPAAMLESDPDIMMPLAAKFAQTIALPFRIGEAPAGLTVVTRSADSSSLDIGRQGVLMDTAALIGPSLIYLTTGYTYDYIPDNSDLVKAFPPSLSHPMGTDIHGRDILARVLLGGRISLMVGIISTLVSLIIGISYGATAGYVGGKVDDVMMRIVDVRREL